MQDRKQTSAKEAHRASGDHFWFPRQLFGSIFEAVQQGTEIQTRLNKYHQK